MSRRIVCAVGQARVRAPPPRNGRKMRISTVEGLAGVVSPATIRGIISRSASAAVRRRCCGREEVCPGITLICTRRAPPTTPWRVLRRAWHFSRAPRRAPTWYDQGRSKPHSALVARCVASGDPHRGLSSDGAHAPSHDSSPSSRRRPFVGAGPTLFLVRCDRHGPRSRLHEGSTLCESVPSPRCSGPPRIENRGLRSTEFDKSKP